MTPHRRSSAIAGLLVFVAAPACAQFQADAPGLVVLPGVRSQVSYSDNVGRRPAGETIDGLVAEITPYVRADYRSAKAYGKADLALRNIFRTVGSDRVDLVRPNLQIGGRTPLAGEWLWFDGSATSLDVNTSALGVLATDPALSNVNRSRYSTLSVGPFIQGRMGVFADYLVRYTYTASRASQSSALLALNDHTLTGRLGSGTQFRDWGWSFNGYQQHRSFGNGFSMNRSNASANAFLLFGGEFKAGASVNYDAIDRLTDDNGNTSGVGPGLFIEWFPNTWTNLSAEIAKPYYGTTGSLRLSHRTQRLTFGLNYTRQLFTSQSASILFFNPATLLGGGLPTAMNPITQQLIGSGLIQDQNTVLGAGVLTDAMVLAQNLSASVGYSGPYLQSNLLAFRSIRNTLLENRLGGGETVTTTSSATRYDQFGLTMANNLRLDSRGSLNLILSLMRSSNNAAGFNQSVRLTMTTLSYQTQLENRMTGTLGIRHSQQSGSEGTASYRENVLFGTLDTRF